MKKLLLLLLVILFTLPSIASARLGETEEENQARYGHPVKNHQDTNTPILKNADNRTYHYQGWKIRIGFFNDRAVRIFYGKLPKPNTTQQLKSYEMEAVLKAEMHGGKWKKMNPASLFSKKDSGNKKFDHARLRWINTNKSIAYCPAGNMGIYIETPEAIIWEEASTNEKEILRKESVPSF